MWEEDPRYQQAAARLVIGLLVAGTVVLAGVCFWIGDFEPFLGWGAGLLVFAAAWFVVAAAVYGLVRLWSWGVARTAKSSGRDRRG